MALLATPLDYTDKDFDALRARLFNAISSAFPSWTDREVANFGNILIESYAFVGDVLTKYQDNQARESRWTQATQRKNIIALAKLIGYMPSGATASRVDVTITAADGAPAGNVPIGAGSVVRTKAVDDPVRFRVLSDTQINAGETQVTGVTVENAEPQSQIFTSSGLPNQQFGLGSTPYLDGSAVVTAGNGAFTQVENFLSSTSTDKHFTIVVDQNDRAVVRFGNGINGAIPSGSITVDYKTGGGSRGKVDAGKIAVIEGTFTDEFGNPVALTVTNPEASSDATDRQTVAQIQEQAPESLRVLNRTVAREDYEINAKRLAGVARALMLTSDEDVGIGENRGILYVIPVGGGNPTSALKDDVLNQVTVEYPNTLTFQVDVSDPSYLTIDVRATVYFRNDYVKTKVRDQIKSRLQDFFAVLNDDGTPNDNVDFGFNLKDDEGNPAGEIAWSVIFNEINDTEGVRKMGDGDDALLLNSSPASPSIDLREFPQLGTVTIIDGSTGAEV